MDVPRADEPGDGQYAESPGECAHRRLGREQELAPVGMIGRDAGQRQQQQLRPELKPHDHAYRRGAMADQLRERQPVLRPALYPGADVGDDRAARTHGSEGWSHRRRQEHDLAQVALLQEFALRFDDPRERKGRGDERTDLAALDVADEVAEHL